MKDIDRNRLQGEVDYGIVTARARRYDAVGQDLMYEAGKAVGEEMGLRALAARMNLEQMREDMTVVSADATLLSWYVDMGEQVPQGVIDTIRAIRQDRGGLYDVEPTVAEAQKREEA